METVLRVVHVLLGLSVISVVLLQRSEGGGIGMGSSSNSFMSVRGTANFLTRVTGILAGLFMVTSLALALLASPRQSKSLFDTVPTAPANQAPASTPAAPAPAPVAPAEQPAPAQPAPAQPPTPSAPAPHNP